MDKQNKHGIESEKKIQYMTKLILTNIVKLGKKEKRILHKNSMNSEIKIRLTKLKLGISEGKVTQAYSGLHFGFQPTPAKVYLVKMPRYNECGAFPYVIQHVDYVTFHCTSHLCQVNFLLSK